MKVLIVGGGGREHALAWRLTRDDPHITLLAAPGNPGIGELARCIPVAATDVDAITALARDERVDFTIVGPEAPLAAGLVDRMRADGLPVFGPTRAAAEIETSKAYAKALMLRAGVPTARAFTCSDAASARRAARELGAPVVIKASGLAAGKGVIIAMTLDDADAAIGVMLEDRTFGGAGDTVLVEEFMTGEELSLFAITDGTRVIPLVGAQDHKRLLEGDRGPNTGGMGAYAPVSFADPTDLGGGAALIADVTDRILRPTLDAMRAEGRPFTGLLYAGLMLTPDGPKVVEFNCRFGDPETQAVLPVIDSPRSCLDLLFTVARGAPLPDDIIVKANGFALTTVIAASGYPEQPRTGDEIELPSADENVLVFHAGTRRGPDGSLLTAGGRVLAITGLGSSLEDARRRSLAYAERVSFAGKQLRRDIGWRELARGAGAS